MARKTKILHFSDLHYGEIKNTHIKHAFVKFDYPDYSKSTLVYSFNQFLQDEANAKNFIDIDFLVLSGDFVCDGNEKDQFNLAKTELIQLCKYLKITDPTKVLIIPGNHDVNRFEDKIKRMVNFYNLFYNPFYTDEYWPDNKKAIVEEQFKINIDNLTDGEKSDGKYIKNNEQSFVHIYEEANLMFIKLYSQNLNAVDVPDPVSKFLRLIHGNVAESNEYKNFIKSLLEKDKKWYFDHGLIESEQLDLCKTQLDQALKRYGRKRYNNFTKIFLCHHNPTQLGRLAYDSNFEFIDINQLSNGAEFIARIQKEPFDGSIILHGHRHRKSFISQDNFKLLRKDGLEENKLLILGAASSGNRDGYADLGFNIITLLENKIEKNVEIQEYLIVPTDRGAEFKISEQNFLRIQKKIKKPIKFITSDEGLEGLADSLYKSNKGGIMIHNYIKTNWIFFRDHSEGTPVGNSNKGVDFQITQPVDSNLYVTPFKRLWENIRNDFSTELFHAFKQSIFANESELNDEITISINQDYYTPKFLEFLRSKRKADLSEIDQFFQELINSSRYRYKTWMVEHWKLATEAKYCIRKGIYFWNSNQVGDDISQGTLKKFNWLLYAINSYKGLGNVYLAWSPFSIDGFVGQSIAAVPRYEESSGSDIYFGWDSKIPVEDDGEISVIHLPGKYGVNDWAGATTKEMRNLLAKSVYPIYHKIQNTFPILTANKLNVNNLMVLVGLFEINYDRQILENIISGYDEDTSQPIQKDTVKKFYESLVPASDQDALFLHWDLKDFNYIMDKLEKL